MSLCLVIKTETTGLTSEVPDHDLLKSEPTESHKGTPENPQC